MWPVLVVVDMPVLDERVSLEEGVEDLAVEELVAKASLEGFDPGLVPGLIPVDEGCPGSAKATPVSDGVRDELRTVVEAYVDRKALLADDLVDRGEDVVRVDRAIHADDEALARLFVDDVQKLERPPIAGLVEVEAGPWSGFGRIGHQTTPGSGVASCASCGGREGPRGARDDGRVWCSCTTPRRAAILAWCQPQRGRRAEKARQERPQVLVVV